MPKICVYPTEGQRLEQKGQLTKEITELVARICSVPAEFVSVEIIEGSKRMKSRGGVPLSGSSAEEHLDGFIEEDLII
jgi:phenylpyruvate tautomerase PptA (4-oxalocrotonate tautomerase family)